jgi:hypothetical protein
MKLSTTEYHSLALKDPVAFLGVEESQAPEGVGWRSVAQELLASQTYRKIVLEADGSWHEDCAPLFVLLGPDYRVWGLQRGADAYVGYDRHATELNLWWEALRASCTSRCGLNAMYGRLVVHRDRRALSGDDKDLRRELINYAVSRYVYKRGYKFVWE